MWEGRGENGLALAWDGVGSKGVDVTGEAVCAVYSRLVYYFVRGFVRHLPMQL